MAGSLLHTLFFFIVALAVLIAVHEYGHYWAARKLGVKVLKFSLGFGKTLYRYQKSPNDTEFTVAALPLGGYVKMVDEREGPVASKDLDHAFNRQPVLSRIAIVAAGPVFNFILAVLLYWAVFMQGEAGTRPVLGEVPPDTYAAAAGLRAGEEIVTVNGHATPTWNLAISEIVEQAMSEQPIEINAKNAEGESRDLLLNIPQGAAEHPEELYQKLGIRPFEPDVPPVIERVEPGSAAAAAGILAGDRIVSADGKPIGNWKQWVDYVRIHPNLAIKTEIDRNGKPVNLEVTPRVTNSETGPIGRIGAAVKIPENITDAMQVEYRLGPLPALGAAVEKTYEYSAMTLKMVWRMLVGKAAVENLSGPISIAQYAGQSASMGVVQFLKFLAIVSISLGVLNLLPIPVLDGGHLMFYGIEAIKGSPVSDNIQLMCQKLGMFILLSLMGLAFVQDIGRLFS